MLSILTLIGFLLLTNNAIAEIDDDLELQKIFQAVENSKSLYAQEIKDLVNRTQAAVSVVPEDITAFGSNKCINNSCFKDSLTNLEKNQGNIQGKYLIFVSFSMPSESLKSLYQEANRHNGVLLLRGLKNGSFKQTAQVLQSLGIGVQIDPLAFKKYQIKKVPTIVLLNNHGFKSLSGNITFQYAKTKLLESQ